MPGFAVHTHASLRLLNHFAADPGAAPFDPRDHAARAAFLHGSFAPDMGYFPGGDSLLTDLAHYVDSTALVRQLFAGASGAVERAFACGWLSHLLVDVRFHRLLNRAHGEAVSGALDRPLTYADDPVLHLRLELGLDAHFATTLAPGRVALAPLFDRESIAFVGDAYERAYGVTFADQRLLRSHRAVGRAHALGAWFTRVAGSYQRGTPRSLGQRIVWWGVARPLALLCRLFARRSSLYALLHPLPPAPWLVATSEEELDGFVARYREHHGALSELPDYNLDTGEPADHSGPYPPREVARQQLAALRGRRPA